MPRYSIVLSGLLATVFLGSSVLTFAGAEELVLAKPSPEQAAWQDLEVGMFIHFAPNTWQNQEGDDLSTPLAKINPEKLDTDQWVRVAQSMGARYIVFVAKHVGGFCMWQTKSVDYGIKETPWRGGKETCWPTWLPPAGRLEWDWACTSARPTPGMGRPWEASARPRKPRTRTTRSTASSSPRSLAATAR